jgi:hypothetical protein
MFGLILGIMVNLSGITQRFAIVRGVLDERSRRLVAAAESVAIGRGDHGALFLVCEQNRVLSVSLMSAII